MFCEGGAIQNSSMMVSSSSMGSVCIALSSRSSNSASSISEVMEYPASDWEDCAGPDGPLRIAELWDAEEGKRERGTSETCCRGWWRVPSLVWTREDPPREVGGRAREPDRGLPEGTLACEDPWTADNASSMLAKRAVFFASVKPLSISACRAARWEAVRAGVIGRVRVAPPSILLCFEGVIALPSVEGDAGGGLGVR